MTYEAPDVTKQAFHCPFCATYAHMLWKDIHVNHSARLPYRLAQCSHCNKLSLWSIDEENLSQDPIRGTMLVPDRGTAPLPKKDMPDDVRIDYEEAARISNKSPRGSAALLRLALQKLCKHLGEKGDNINDDIRSLASKSIVPASVIRVADTVRIMGNNAVHPGEMSDEDFDHVSDKLFDLLNFIVKKAITEPNEIEELYERMPEGARSAAEKQDRR